MPKYQIFNTSVLWNFFGTSKVYSFFFQNPQCKHLLAVHLAEALGESKKQDISDEDFVAYMCYDSSADDKNTKELHV